MNKTTMNEVKLIHDSSVTPHEWRVEEIASDGDGGCSIAIFAGPFAESRAKRYADHIGALHAATRAAFAAAAKHTNVGEAGLSAQELGSDCIVLG